MRESGKCSREGLASELNSRPCLNAFTDSSWRPRRTRVICPSDYCLHHHLVFCLPPLPSLSSSGLGRRSLVDVRRRCGRRQGSHCQRLLDLPGTPSAVVILPSPLQSHPRLPHHVFGDSRPDSFEDPIDRSVPFIPRCLDLDWQLLALGVKGAQCWRPSCRCRADSRLLRLT